MFISKLGCPERGGNHTLTFKGKFKNLKIHDLLYALQFQTYASPVHVSLSAG